MDLTSDLYLGYDWLLDHDPEIDWDTGQIDFSRCKPSAHDIPTMPTLNYHHLYIRGVSMDLQITDSIHKKEKTIDDLPDLLSDFKDVFSPTPNDQLPPF